MTKKSISNKLRDLQQLITSKMPITRYLEFSFDHYDENGLVLSAPLKPNINHRGTAFGGSIGMLAILAGYGMTFLLLEDFITPYHIVIQNEKVTFLNPIKNNFKVFCARPKPSDSKKLKSMFLKKGKGRIYQHCSILENESSIEAAKFEGSFVVIKDDEIQV